MQPSCNPTSRWWLCVSHIWKPEWFLLFAIFIMVRRIWAAKCSNQFINWPVLGMFPSYLLHLRTGFYEGATTVLKSQGGACMFKGPSFCNFEYILTSDPRNLEHILKTNFYDFHRGKSMQITLQDLFGTEAMLTTDHDVWHSRRRMVATKITLADFNKMAMKSWVDLIQFRLLHILDEFVSKYDEFDLHAVFSRLLLDQSCMTTFGVDLGCLTDGLPTVHFARAWYKAQDATALRFYLPVFAWKLMKYLSLGSERALKESVKQMNEFAYNVIATRKMELFHKSTDTKSKSRSDFLSLLIETKDNNGNVYSDMLLRDSCFNVMTAGADTIAVALSWFFWLLDQNPVAEKEIYAEISGIIGGNANMDDGIGAIFTPDVVKKMSYLHAALSETLRLYPPVPFNQSEVNNEGQFPNGVKLKKGVRVIIASYAMGRMESIWGKDCREFKPERWMRDGIFVAESQYKFPAFNAGLRNCLGKDLSYHQMKVVAAYMIYRYRVNVVENHPVEPKLGTVLHMKYGLKVTFHRRSGEPEQSPNQDCNLSL